jgi:hypothetical protein
MRCRKKDHCKLRKSLPSPASKSRSLAAGVMFQEKEYLSNPLAPFKPYAAASSSLSAPRLRYRLCQRGPKPRLYRDTLPLVWGRPLRSIAVERYRSMLPPRVSPHRLPARTASHKSFPTSLYVGTWQQSLSERTSEGSAHPRNHFDPETLNPAKALASNGG